MRIQHNIMAMNAYRNYTNNVSAMKANLEKLSSGYKINRAGDDAAGLAISEKMRAQITGLETAQKNAKDGISLVQTAEGALTEVHDMLNRMVELATQSANGTYDVTTDRKALQQELDQLKEEINRISKATNYNGINLLDGSMDSTVKTTDNAMAEGFGIADWVGSLNNESATVGTGTIVHTGSVEAQATSFAIELNNSTVSGTDGVKLTLGEGENAVTLELDSTEIQEGATADEIAAAIAAKYDGSTDEKTVNFKSADGSDIKFNVTANGDRIELVQASKPKNANEVVNASMALKTEGIGMPSAADDSERLNVTAPTLKDTTKDSVTNKAGVTPAASNAFQWQTGLSDEEKDALNKVLADGTASIKYSATANSTSGGITSGSRQLDVSKLQKALGDDYEVIVKDGGTAKTVTNGIATLGDSAGVITVDIVKAGSKDPIATLTTASAGLPGTTTNGTTYETTLTLGAGNNQTMNVAPAISVDDPANLEGSTALLTVGDASGNDLSEDQLTELNKALASGDQTITLHYEGLNGNQTANTSKLYADLSQGLKDAGYYLATNSSSPENNKYDPDTGFTANGKGNGDDELFLVNSKNEVVGKIVTNADNATNLTSAETTITLSQNGFNKEAKVTATANSGNIAKAVAPFEAYVDPDDPDATPTDLSTINWGDSTNNVTLKAGDKFNFEIGGKTYTITCQDGGVDPADTAAGTVIDISSNLTGSGLKSALQTALQKQVNAANKANAAGNQDYTEYTNVTLSVNANSSARLDITADTANCVYVGKNEGNAAPGADGSGSGSSSVSGGKDWNAATVTQVQGNAASTGRLASTYITAEDLAGLKDGSQMRIGDKVYTFAVGKGTTAEGDNIVDLTHMEVGDAGLTGEALSELYKMTTAAADNAMFSTGYDGTKLTFTENKEYDWGEGVDLSTHAGIAEQFGFYTDGMTSTTQGKSLTLQIGDTADEYNKISLNIAATNCEALGLDAISVADQEDAQDAVDVIKAAINQVSTIRGTLGATQNRLDHTINNLSVMTENIQDAESTIRDVDVAEEMMAYTKNNILIQSAQAMLAQANQVPQGVLQLLG